MASEPKRQRVASESSEGLQSETIRDSIKTLEGSPRNKDVITESEYVSATSGASSQLISLQSNNNSSDNDQISFPNNLRNWDRKHLEKLNIKVSFQPDTSPLQLIRKIQKTGLQIHEVRKMEADEEEKKIALLVTYVKQSKFMEMLAKINYTTFDDVNRNCMRGIDMYADDRYMCSFIPDGLPKNLKLWFYRFHTHGKMFAYVLHKMVENKEEGVPIDDCHFQHLFDTFAKMFGLRSDISIVPCLQVPKMTVMDTEVCGTPDIIYSRHCLKLPVDVEMKSSCIVAVCKVKKERPVIADSKSNPSPESKSNPSPESSTKRGKTKNKQKLSADSCSEISSSSVTLGSNAGLPHLSDKLIGQHGGELLFNYHQSNRCNLIIGMVVQQTQITFTTLEMTEGQYERIKTGKFKHADKERPVFTFTKAYDYLNEEDLESIIEPLIRLGLEQNK